MNIFDINADTPKLVFPVEIHLRKTPRISANHKAANQFASFWADAAGKVANIYAGLCRPSPKIEVIHNHNDPQFVYCYRLTIYGPAEEHELYQKIAETVMGTLDTIINPSPLSPPPLNPVEDNPLYLLTKNAAKEFHLGDVGLNDRRSLTALYIKMKNNLSNNHEFFVLNLKYKVAEKNKYLNYPLFNYEEILKNETLNRPHMRNSKKISLKTNKTKKIKETTEAKLFLLSLEKDIESVFILGKSSEQKCLISNETRKIIESNLDLFRDQKHEYIVDYPEICGKITFDLLDKDTGADI